MLVVISTKQSSVVKVQYFMTPNVRCNSKLTVIKQLSTFKSYVYCAPGLVAGDSFHLTVQFRNTGKNESLFVGFQILCGVTVFK